MAAKKCLICNRTFAGRRDAKTCSSRCRKRLQLVKLSFSGSKARSQLAKAVPALVVSLLGMVLVLLGGLPQNATAATSSTLNFQARLLNSAGQVIPDGNYNIEFKIYDSVSSGASAQGVCSLNSSTDDCWWVETRTGGSVVRVVNGYFSVNLGSVTAFGSSIPWDQPLWLTMNIGGTGGSPSWDGEMLASGNRIQLTGVPYAFRAGSLAKNNGTQTGTLSFNTVANSPNILLPDASGTICLQSASDCGFAPGTASSYIQNGTSLQANANFNIQSAANGSIGGIIRGASAQTADIFQLQYGPTGASVFRVDKDGNTVVQTRVNSGNALAVVGSSGAIAFTVDTSNDLGRVGIGNTADVPQAILHVSSDQPAPPALLLVTDATGTDVNVLTIADEGATTFRNRTNSTGAFQVQNAAGNNYILVNTSGASVSVGDAGIASTVQVGNTTGAVVQTINIGNNATAASTSNINIGSSVGGTTAITGPTTVTNRTSGSPDTFNVSNSTSTGSIARFLDGDSANPVFSLANGGAANFQNQTNSVSAFQIQNALGSNALRADTTALNSFLTNSNFEGTDVSAWVYLGTPGSVARDTTQSYLGLASLKVVTTANASNGVKYVTGNGAGALATSSTYTISWYDKLDSASAGLTDIRAVYARNGSAETACTGINTQIVLPGGWIRHSCQIVTDGTAPAATAYVAIEQTAGVAHTFYIDGVQIEAGSTASAYKESGLFLSGVISSPAAFKNQSDSTTAFQIQNATGGQLFNIDSLNSNITINGSNSGMIQAWQTGNSSGFSARDSYASVTAGGYIYIIGGDSGSTSSSVFYAKINANGNVGNWSTTTSLPTARANPSAAVANGYIYVTGGSSNTANSGATDTVYYGKINRDGTISSWTTSANPVNVSGSKKRWQHSTVAYNGYLYVLGGIDEGANNVNSVYYSKLNADGSNGTWAATNTMNIGAGHSSVVANGYVYNMGFGTTTTEYAKLNPDGTTGAWNTTSALPAGRKFAGIGVANGYIYLIGGSNAAGNTYYASTYFAPLNADGTIGAWSCQGSAGDCTGTTPVNSTALPGTRSAIGNTNLMYNGYIYVIGGWNGSVQSSVYYTSTSRIKLNGSLDLVGDSGENLSEGGSGGVLTAGNTNIIGNLGVRGQASFNQGVDISDALNVNGSALFKNAANSTAAFQIQNAAGASLLTADTTNFKLVSGGDITASAAATGTTATTSGTGTNVTTVTLSAGAFTNGDVIFIDNAGQDYFTRITAGGGTTSLTVSPAVTFENSRTVTKYTIQNIGATSTDYATLTNRFFQGYFLGGIVVGAGSTTISDGLISSTGSLSLSATDINFKRSADSAAAFQVQNAAGSAVFTTDTQNGRVQIGSSTTNATANLLVLDSYNQGTDPTGVNGGMYYNTNTNKFRCYQNSAWIDCAGSGSGSTPTLQDAYNNSSSPATIATTSAAKNIIVKSGSGFNSTGLFQVQNAAGANILTIDSSTSANLVTNGDIEGGATAGWSAKGAATLSQSSAEQYQGNNSLSVATTAAANDGAKYDYTFTASTAYSLSLYAKVSSGSISDFVIGRQDVSGTDVNCLTAQTVTTNWTRFSCSFTTGGTITSSNIYIQKSDTAAETVFIDGIQLEAGSSVTAFNAGGGLQLSGLINSPAAFKNKSNSTTAFLIQNAAGVSLLSVDTLNSTITLGPASATPTILVLGTKNTSGDPAACTNGAIYYQADTTSVTLGDQFRMCQRGTWDRLGGSRPTVRVSASANQSISTATQTALSFDVEILASGCGSCYDNWNMHSNVTNNSRLTAPSSGKYQVWGTVEFAANATGFREVCILTGGTTVQACQKAANAGSSDTVILNVNTTVVLSSGSYVELMVRQNSGSNLNVLLNNDLSPVFGMTKVAEVWD